MKCVPFSSVVTRDMLGSLGGVERSLGVYSGHSNSPAVFNTYDKSGSNGNGWMAGFTDPNLNGYDTSGGLNSFGSTGFSNLNGNYLGNLGLGTNSLNNFGFGTNNVDGLGIRSNVINGLNLGSNSMEGLGLGTNGLEGLGLGIHDLEGLGLGTNGLEELGLGINGLEGLGLETNGLEGLGLGIHDLERLGLGNNGLKGLELGTNGLDGLGLGNNGLHGLGLGNNGFKGLGLGTDGLEGLGLEGLELGINGLEGHGLGATSGLGGANSLGTTQGAGLSALAQQNNLTPHIINTAKSPSSVVTGLNTILPKGYHAKSNKRTTRAETTNAEASTYGNQNTLNIGAKELAHLIVDALKETALQVTGQSSLIAYKPLPAPSSTILNAIQTVIPSSETSPQSVSSKSKVIVPVRKSTVPYSARRTANAIHFTSETCLSGSSCFDCKGFGTSVPNIRFRDLNVTVCCPNCALIVNQPTILNGERCTVICGPATSTNMLG